MSHAPRDIPADTRAKQRRASDPSRSAWVSANAGSGKTFVLTRRVVRLLLGGTAPSRILCLTFTKAAAANMAVRVFDTLAAWVGLDDARLAAAIVETGAPAPGAAELAAARRLFARTVETPGGLKILTIHAFCEKLLHAFPFEANVAAGFSVIEELRQDELMGRARETVLAEAVATPGSQLALALDVLTRGTGLDAFNALLRDVATHRTALQGHGLDAIADCLAEALGTAGDTVAGLERAMVEDGLPPTEWDAVGRSLLEAANGRHAVAEALIAAAAAPPAARCSAYLAVFLTQKLEPRAATALSRPLRAAEPALCARLDAEQARIVALLARRRAAHTHERTMALLAVARAVLDRYETLKRRAGLLDFADLIERSRELLGRSDSAWVLYKLDAGIDHILVDEAQDTAPDQWAILQAISRDFFAGEGASRTRRTIFAVGDEKQSIYSFQGARPAMMAAVRNDMRARAAAAGHAFESVDLLLSFRSVAAVLAVIDKVFAHSDNARGLAAEGEQAPPHQALKAALPGFVEIWPLVKPTALPDPTDWRLPVDVQEAGAPAVVLADRVAGEIARLIAPASGETVAGEAPGSRRAVGAGDILVLVRSRNAFFEAVIRALKEKGVPVAGADRLILTDHIATMDLVAAGRAALLPDDDYSLACVLKSPLIGLDDDDLIRLAPRRDGTLQAALQASDEPRDRAAAQRLAIWRDRAATLTPFGFYTRLLGQDGGRRQLLGRLGPEAADVLDEFLALTLAHERDGAPSLLAFLARLEAATLPVKRDLEAAGQAVRVMTVHAAKGLEARIVILPDTCGAPNGRHDPKLFRLTGEEGGAPLLAWSGKASEDTGPVAVRREAERAAALDEHRRLLYVALTRAEERLVIAGYQGTNANPPACWYDMIVAADLGASRELPAPWDPDETVIRYGQDAPRSTVHPQFAFQPMMPAPPPWIGRPAIPEAAALPPIRPSGALVAADAEAGESDAVEARPRRAAALAGRLMHRLLQHLPALPPAARRDAGLRFLLRHGAALPSDAHDSLVTQALAVIDAPALAALFGAGSRAEVAVAARIPRPGGGVPLNVTGQIDRLGETAAAVHLADFKSGRPRPLAETPPGYLAQLALYAAAVAPLFPGKPVQASLVWTEGPVILPIDEATLAVALADALAEAAS